MFPDPRLADTRLGRDMRSASYAHQRDRVRVPLHRPYGPSRPHPSVGPRSSWCWRCAWRLGTLKHLAGVWRATFVITAVTALYLNVFVLVVQLFGKTPALQELAPTQSEAPFAVTQALVLVLFVWIGRAALRGFTIATVRASRATAH